jgi:hypothetical protein
VHIMDAEEPHTLRAVHGVAGPTCVLIVG